MWRNSFLRRLLGRVFPLTGNDMLLLRRAAVYLKPYKFSFVLAFASVGSGIVFGLVQPYCFGKIIASVMEKDIDLFILVFSLMLAAFVLQQLITFFQAYIFTALNENLMYDVKKEMFAASMRLPVKLFDRIRIGDLLSRLNGDSGIISQIITSHFISSIINVLQVLIVGFVVFAINWLLALIVILSIPLSLSIYALFGKVLREKNAALAGLRDAYFSKSQETFSGIKEIKALGITGRKKDEFNSLLGLLKVKAIGLGLLNTMMQSAGQFVKYAAEAVVLAVGFYFVITGRMKLELFIAFTSYSSQLSEALIALTGLNANLQQAMVSIGRIFEVIDGFGLPAALHGKRAINKVQGSIQFRHVTFGYSSKENILDDVNLDIPAFKKVAIVGASGGGKSTLLNLLLRFYEPQQGTILVDGINLQEFTEASLRDNLAVVLQEPFLFNTSIRENILFACPEATAGELVACCKAANIHDEILLLTDGYDFQVGENGNNLSGGQKQRLAIARALLRRTPVILFDEATSALDNEAQFKIKSALDSIRSDHTLVVIAHRLVTIIDADLIYVLKQGKVAGSGNHHELISQNETYRNLYQTELDTLLHTPGGQLNGSCSKIPY